MSKTEKYMFGCFAAIAVMILLSTICTVNFKGGSTAAPVSGQSSQPIVVNSESTDKHLISVEAEKEVIVTPDVATVDLSVRSEAASIEESQNKNTEDMNAVLAKLAEIGIEDKNIQTYNYQVYPQYDYVTDERGYDTRVLTGYRTTSSIQVKNIEIAKVSSVLTGCVQAGITEIDSLSYEYSKYDEAYDQALKDAIAEARRKADNMLTDTGMTIVCVDSITEGYQNKTYKAYDSGLAMNTLAAMDSDEAVTPDVQIQPGEINIEAEVSVSYVIDLATK